LQIFGQGRLVRPRDISDRLGCTGQTMRWLAAIGTVAGLSAAGCGTDASTSGVKVPSTGPALVNGDFANGLQGWTTVGDGSAFRVFRDEAYGDRWTLCTDPGLEPVTSASAVQGELAQEFAVPEDAKALRFVVWGGHSHVRLLDGAKVLRAVIGPEDSDARTMVSWPLEKLRGTRVRLSILDDDTDEPWGWVAVSGFDVIRDEPSALVDAHFENGHQGWQADGEGASFPIFADAVTGNQRSVITWTSEGTRAVGRLYQDFTVPNDAIALRFVTSGGADCFVRLYVDGRVVDEGRGTGSDTEHRPYSWDLVALRGKPVRLSIEDEASDGPLAFLGVSGFDLITATNGP
jgi:hypothetical protein